MSRKILVVDDEEHVRQLFKEELVEEGYEVFLAAGKTYDVTIQPKQTTAGTYDAATYALFDRALGVSTNNQPDGGMQAYLQVAGGALQRRPLRTRA